MVTCACSSLGRAGTSTHNDLRAAVGPDEGSKNQTDDKEKTDNEK